MTAPTPTPAPDAEPICWPVPDWVTDPDTRESIAVGHLQVHPDFMGGSNA
ncbi:hypothetical protein ACIQMV_08445 [Streptomyces sp. NPDC091412]